ncbi:lipopolysaccharide biosynthesis protein [Mesoterricola sediminis]|uniref:Membrane protein involved in the export of O-antigen and teichoic acid n=1 Tax=Mesoterricola sediminis TaxID=2927980 RepID=A0AA48KAP9_9BACT|nr:oligosaccharide flippase family protein [Mesoterricola sediminis]BDU75289.1 hypothetical protein METESE_02470 [Mesoterricola sediminis]
MSLALFRLFHSSRSVRNVVWNLVGGLTAGVLIVLATPQYVHRLGLEGYGIVGLWLMMQVLMGLLDMGMGATIVKEFADSREEGGAETKQDLLRTLEIIYGSLALALALVLACAAGGVAARWLKAPVSSPAHIAWAIRLMALTLGFQFPTVLYANGIAGLQAHGRMNLIQIAGNCLRYGAGVAILLVRPDLVWFFAVQALVAGVQMMATREVLWSLLRRGSSCRPTFKLALFKRLWRFSAGMALTAFSGVLVANADRIALSKLMPTAELGKYAVAYTATGLLQMGIQPFYKAFFPRYAELVSLRAFDALRNEYLRSCGLMAGVIIPLGVAGWIFAPQLFTIWLGTADPTIVRVFRWLILSITCSGLMWLPAAFQQANGKPGLHATMIILALLAGVPVMVWAIRVYGTVGATAVWLIHGLSGISVEIWLMHRLMLKGDMLRWYWRALIQPLCATLPILLGSRWLLPAGCGRLATLGWIGLAGLVGAGCSVGLALVGPTRKPAADPS